MSDVENIEGWLRLLSSWMERDWLFYRDKENNDYLSYLRSIYLPPSCRGFYAAVNIVGWESFSKIKILDNFSFRLVEQIDVLALSSGVMSNINLCAGEETVPMLLKKGGYSGCGELKERDPLFSVIAPAYLVAIGDRNKKGLVINPLVINEEGEWESVYFDLDHMKYCGFRSLSHAMSWMYASRNGFVNFSEAEFVFNKFFT